MGSGEPSVNGFISKAFLENFLPTQRPVNRSAASVDGHMVGSNPSVNGLFEALIFKDRQAVRQPGAANADAEAPPPKPDIARPPPPSTRQI
jgi:hypothetical protein